MTDSRVHTTDLHEGSVGMIDSGTEKPGTMLTSQLSSLADPPALHPTRFHSPRLTAAIALSPGSSIPPEIGSPAAQVNVVPDPVHPLRGQMRPFHRAGIVTVLVEPACRVSNFG